MEDKVKRWKPAFLTPVEGVAIAPLVVFGVLFALAFFDEFIQSYLSIFGLQKIAIIANLRQFVLVNSQIWLVGFIFGTLLLVMCLVYIRKRKKPVVSSVKNELIKALADLGVVSLEDREKLKSDLKIKYKGWNNDSQCLTLQVIVTAKLEQLKQIEKYESYFKRAQFVEVDEYRDKYGLKNGFELRIYYGKSKFGDIKENEIW